MRNLQRFNEFLFEDDEEKKSIGAFATKFIERIKKFEDLKPKGTPIPFKDNTEGNAFRKWVNDKYPDYATQIELSSSSSKDDGYNNEYIKKAWEKYGEEYTKSLSEKSSEIPFKNKEEGNKFRAWVNDKYPDYAKDLKLDKQGPYNNETIKKAWKEKGKDYEKDKK